MAQLTRVPDALYNSMPLLNTCVHNKEDMTAKPKAKHLICLLEDAELINVYHDCVFNDGKIGKSQTKIDHGRKSTKSK